MNTDWSNNAACAGEPRNDFFDNYEDDILLRRKVDQRCSVCPVVRECFAAGVFLKSTGVWGGIYLIDGVTDDEFNNHKTPDVWAKLYGALTA